MANEKGQTTKQFYLEIIKGNRKSIVKYFSRVFFGESDVNVEQKVFMSAALISFFGALAGLIWNSFLELPSILNILVAIFIIIYFLLYYFLRFKNRFSPFIFMLVSIVFLSILYIMNGGLKGSIPSLYLVYLVAFIFIFDSKYQPLILIATLGSLLGLVVLEFTFFEDLIIQYDNSIARELDLVYSYIACMVVIFLFANYYKKIITSKNNQLQKLVTSKELVFSIIAHDLRRPFNNILGFAGLMTDKSEDLTKDELQKYAETINKESQKTFELLESLLEWGKIQTHNININQQKIYLNQIVNEIISSFNEIDTLNKPDIKLQISSDIYVLANSVILKTILRNLISNAIKFTPAEGKINISAEEYGAKHLAICVRDNGIGMNKEMVENLFNFETNTNRNGINGESSAGLGLIITKDLVEKQGGKLIIESEENKGSTFKFTVPKP